MVNFLCLGSLSALVYQHTVTSLALPCLLVLPESDPAAPRVTTSAQILQTQGAGKVFIQIIYES